jgi:hypothetical protein
MWHEAAAGRCAIHIALCLYKSMQYVVSKLTDDHYSDNCGNYNKKSTLASMSNAIY